MKPKEKSNTLDFSQDRLGEYLIFLAVVVAIGSFLVHEIYSLDVWWQVTIGKDILKNMSIPVVDKFSAAALGNPYHDSHWLFQVILASCHILLEWVGVELFMIFVLATALFFTYRSARQYASFNLSVILTFVVAMLSVERFLPRPEIITFLMLAIFYYLLQKEKFTSVRGLALFGILQAVWANCHGLFILGPFLAACYWIQECVRQTRIRSSNLLKVTLLLLVLVLATFATPFSIKGWSYAYLLFTEVGRQAPDLMQSLGELSPTFGAAAMSAPAFWFFFVLSIAVLISSLILLFRKRYPPLGRTLIIAITFIAAMTGRRNIVLFGLVGAPFLAENISRMIPEKMRVPQFLAPVVAAIIFVFALFPLSGKYYLYMEIPARFGFGVTPSFFPHKLPGFLKKSGFEGQVFNSNTLGGFYLYHSYPESYPLTDGRWEIYSERELEFIRKAPQDPASWDKLVAKYSIKGILLQHASPEAHFLIKKLRFDPRWKLVYFDYSASFWKRSDILADLHEIKVPENWENLLPSKRVDDHILLDLFLSQLDVPEIQIKNLERAFELGLQKSQFLEQYGMLQIRLRDFDRAKSAFQRVLRKDPRNAKILNEMAFLEFRDGNIERSFELLTKALKEEPDNENIRANFDKVRIAIQQKKEAEQ